MHSNEDFLFKLLKAEGEDEVTEILRYYNYLEYDDTNWQPYGGLKNNFGSIGNQQSDSVSALVEKIVNSIDAVLIRECLLRGIDPESDEAPRNMEEAAEKFFNIPEGKLSKLSAVKRGKLADDNIIIYVSGKKAPDYPCITIVDKGEGQHPSKFPDTFLSLHKNNKNEIPFVQGKYNMGGSGVLPYCGERYNYQLIVSKRHPQLSEFRENKWGFTLVRRRPPLGKEKCSRYEYLAPNNEILTLNIEKLPLSRLSTAVEESIEWGTLIKLYEYNITEKTMATTDLYRALNRHLYAMVIPTRIVELRDYRGHTKEATLCGMSVRLEEDKGDVLEEGFPTSIDIKLEDGGEISVVIALFKPETKQERWIKRKEAIIFIVNGQAHAFLPNDFFRKEEVNLRWISSDLMIIVDCSKLSRELQENMFMASRDRMRQSFGESIEKELAKFLKHHKGLREWNEKRHKEFLEKKLKKANIL